ncbi:MAG: hypothetical protein K2X03_10285 [Bryobacteraceae bacterium]|nr:hypothetical protein [Bryobacteraceae bacterium]
MSAAGPPNPLAAGSLTRGAFTYFPVAPGRVEFAAAVRERILEERPAVVAVELPVSIEEPFYAALDRLPALSAIVYPDGIDDESNIYVIVEPTDPFTEAVRTARETGARVVFIDPAIGERPHLPDDYPDPFAIRYLGLDRYLELYRLDPQPRTDETDLHAARLAWKLQGADPFAKTLIVLSLNLLDPVLDAMETPQSAPSQRYTAPPVTLLHPHPDCLAEVCVEYPYLQHVYESERRSVDRGAVQVALFRDAAAAYHTNTGEKIEHWHRRYLARYTRNLAAVSGYLVASLYELTVAARSIVDDNYGWEVWNMANQYPPQAAPTPLEVVNLAASEIWINTRKVRLRRRLPRRKQQLKPANLKMRKKEGTPGEWAKQLNGDSICSYPPEDLVIETYGRFLKSKAKRMLADESERVVPFTSSLLDGIDLRETIRHWHQRKLYVRETRRSSGEVGAVVVIFDEDTESRYNYMTTWLGEHQNESDMAFYATHPFEHLVGPGIGRAEYGGFLMTLPAGRMFDVWADPDYDFAETKSERLLMAGLDYSQDRHVVYVAAKPPRTVFRSIAAQLGRKLIYLPIGQLNPAKLKKVRVVHVLDGHERRPEAKDYLW